MPVTETYIMENSIQGKREECKNCNILKSNFIKNNVNIAIFMYNRLKK